MENRPSSRSRKQPKAPILIGKHGLLDLPAEIRNRIFQLALEHETDRELTVFPLKVKQVKRSPGLLVANRQVRAETLPVLRNQVSIRILALNSHEWELGKTWLQKQLAESKFETKKLCIEFSTYSNFGITIYGFLGSAPAYEITPYYEQHNREGPRNRLPPKDFRKTVESNIEQVQMAAQKLIFGVEEFIAFGDKMIQEYYSG